MKPKSQEETTEQSLKIKDTRKKFQEHLSIKDDSMGQSVNNVNPNEWVITNLAFPTNYLPQGTLFKHISFIPVNIPDFRKVELSAKYHSDTSSSSSSTLKSTTVKPQMYDTINKREIKNMLTSITGKPTIDLNKSLNDVQSRDVIATGIVSFLTSSSSEGSNDFDVNELKLQIDKKIKASQLQQNIKNHLFESVDLAIKQLGNSKIVANSRKAEDTFIYIIERLLYK